MKQNNEDSTRFPYFINAQKFLSSQEMLYWIYLLLIKIFLIEIHNSLDSIVRYGKNNIIYISWFFRVDKCIALLENFGCMIYTNHTYNKMILRSENP